MMTPAQYLRTPSAWDRRTFLKAAAVAANWPFLQARQGSAATPKVQLSNDPFQLGVASGDPTHDGVVIWTRLAPEPLTGGGMPPENVPVQWSVASDDQMKNVVQSGTTIASKDWAHSVHVEVEGLKPDRTYWYQFIAADTKSPIGRTRTAPAPGVMLDKLRFAFASCQHWETGYYTAYENMCKDDLNLVIHLGDYIYEGKATPKRTRLHIGPELETLEDYRNRHAQYKTDRHLQATHHAFPWVVTWDDHEFDNNCAGDISEQPNVSPVEFLKRRANAYKAYYEHMPLRKSTIPNGPYMELYRTVKFGSLLEFNVLDTRQYRSDQNCGDGNKQPCAEVFSPDATMLGQTQENWLNKQLSQSRAKWNVLAQQVMMARVDRNPNPDIAHWSMDQWAGYDVPRKRLIESLQTLNVSNPVVLTGDIHTNWVNDLKADFDQPESATVATEFVGTSISSGGDGTQTRKDTEGVLKDNPFVRFYNAERGYVRCELNSKEWKSDYQTFEYVSREGAPATTRASFVVEAGRPGAQRVS
ncbi:alkaline phosphatase D family protein [Planctomicrobium sp. SH527]|uniref:alkaline phosphatase D family protein n=1 Tax=Planctomicrobium sp. SH527 TaxID=3448123 RepID=UPI003F5CB7C6